MLCITDKEMSSSLLKWRGFYLTFIEDVLEIIREKNIKAKFITPVISSSSFGVFYKKYFDKEDIIEKSIKDKWLEIILSEYYGYIPNINEKEIVLLPDEDLSIILDKVNKNNEELKKNNSLLENKDIIPDLKTIYVESIKNITKEDYEEERWMSIKTKKIDKVTFFQLVNADFMINATPFYHPNKIKEFIESEILNE